VTAAHAVVAVVTAARAVAAAARAEQNRYVAPMKIGVAKWNGDREHTARGRRFRVHRPIPRNPSAR
jgi:hypothetical protein